MPSAAALLATVEPAATSSVTSQAPVASGGFLADLRTALRALVPETATQGTVGTPRSASGPVSSPLATQPAQAVATAGTNATSESGRGTLPRGTTRAAVPSTDPVPTPIDATPAPVAAMPAATAAQVTIATAVPTPPPDASAPPGAAITPQRAPPDAPAHVAGVGVVADDAAADRPSPTRATRQVSERDTSNDAPTAPATHAASAELGLVAPPAMPVPPSQVTKQPTDRSGDDTPASAPHTIGTAASTAQTQADVAAPPAMATPDATTTPALATVSASPHATGATTGVTSTTRVTPTPHAEPATQVASAVARLAVTHSNARLDLTLTPPDLGRVEIHVERGGDGSAAVSLRVERPETLAALQRDAPQLHAALDRAGVSGERSVSLALADPGATSSSSFASAGSAGGQGGASGQRQRGRGATGSSGSDRDDDSLLVARVTFAAPRADGLDITA